MRLLPFEMIIMAPILPMPMPQRVMIIQIPLTIKLPPANLAGKDCTRTIELMLFQDDAGREGGVALVAAVVVVVRVVCRQASVAFAFVDVVLADIAVDGLIVVVVAAERVGVVGVGGDEIWVFLLGRRGGFGCAFGLLEEFLSGFLGFACGDGLRFGVELRASGPGVPPVVGGEGLADAEEVFADGAVDAGVIFWCWGRWVFRWSGVIFLVSAGFLGARLFALRLFAASSGGCAGWHGGVGCEDRFGELNLL